MKKGISCRLTSTACIATAVFLSSCSNEVGVEPLTEKVQLKVSEPSLRIDPPKFYPTNGQSGIGNTVEGWNGYAPSNSVYGVSTLSHLGGDVAKAWIKPLPQPAPGVNTFLTTTTGTGLNGYSSYYSGFIKNLIPGQKYKITFQVSSASLQEINNGQYGTSAAIRLHLLEDLAPGSDSEHSITKLVDLTNKPAQWVTETITFIAPKMETRIEFRNNSPWGTPTFVNLHVGPGAIQKVNNLVIQ